MKRCLRNWAGYILTLAVFVVGVTPGTFDIPQTWYPWLLFCNCLGGSFFIRSI